MLLMVPTEKFQKHCKEDLYIDLVWSSATKTSIMKEIFASVGINARNFTGTNSEEGLKENAIIQTPPDASEEIAELLLHTSKQYYILIIAPCTDLARAIKKVTEKDKMLTLDNIVEIYWAGGWGHNQYASFNVYRDIDATKYLLGHKALKKRSA
uniref:AlNc14C512G12000 protein n=1 Tax=Albugo laibachii Nc14 TaxID=890382 RepID=F0X0Q5_9STRA|nr:AlNc14C512G12000 [Albugo laibachii Nc14]|eukprot:CCA27349.1 AlNc14C512G12000 [Albugo laibachii Nc14]